MMAAHTRLARTQAAAMHWRWRCQEAALKLWRQAVQQRYQLCMAHACGTCKRKVLLGWHAAVGAAREGHRRRGELLQTAVAHMQRK